MEPTNRPSIPPVDPATDRLDSWKEIAAHLKRDVSTVQRWEKKEGLPVHRLLHDKLGSVYAYKSELDGWWQRGRHDVEPVEDAGASRRPRRWLFWAGAAAAAVTVAMLLAVGGLRWLRADAGRAPIRSLAVLSLANLTGDPQQDYFVEGLTEALGAELSKIRSLQVISGRSASRYRTAEKSGIEIARELNVDALIEGAVVRSGSRVRVTVHLVDGRTDRRLWTSSFDSELGDILILYADIARAVAGATSATVTGVEGKRPARSQFVNPKAYEAYLRGQYFRKRWQAGGCVQADQYFLEAIALDPAFAPAYAARAYCYGFPDRLGLAGPQIHPVARDAALRAIELDPDLAAGHHALAGIRLRLEHDWAGAERELRRALELDPISSDAHMMMGEYLYLSGRNDESVAMMRRTLELDPFHLDRNVAVGFGLYHLRGYDEAIAQFRRTLELDPNWATARLWLAESYAAQGSEIQAVNEYVEWLRQVLVPDRMAQATASLADAYRRSGWRSFWERELELAQEETRRPGSVWRSFQNQYCGPYYMARRYARLGDRERAIAALEAAYEQRHHLMVFLKIERVFDGLRSDARFQDLVRRVNIP